MWAYRLDKSPNPLGMTLSVKAMRAKLVDLYDVFQTDPKRVTITPEMPTNFDRDVIIAKNMAASLGWDTTMLAMDCYLVPSPFGYMYGFILTQATGGQRYIVSPVPLPYMDEHVDWDAHTSLEEVQKTMAALDGKPERPSIKYSDWKQSAKGNPYCQINGAQCTIFPVDGGFKAILANSGVQWGGRELKTFTNAFKTQQECAEYVFKNFYGLTKEWGASSDEDDDPRDTNPFAGVDWSGGEDD